MRLVKSENKHNTILFVVLAPSIPDRNGDYIEIDDITKTAHEFMINLNEKKINVDHEEGTDIDEEEYNFVESYIMPCDFEVSEGLVIPMGSWILGIKFSDGLYKDILNGEYIGISMEGTGVRLDA